MLTDLEIKTIYAQYLKNNNDQYLDKYVEIDESKNNKKWSWVGKDFPRVAALLDLDGYVHQHNLKSEHMLLFYGNEPELEYIPHNNLSTFDYEKDQKYDLHNLDIPEGDYDFSILCQTLEHLYDPLLCVKNIYKYLKKDAYFYVNVPTVNIQHVLPYNFYTGFTPVGLGCLLKQAGFNILEIGHWGNLDYIYKIFSSRQWPDYRQVNRKNDFLSPCQSWVLAKK